MDLTPVILAGGHGSRLWPLSTAQKPKQFLSLLGEQSMLQMTLARLNDLQKKNNPLIVCNESHRFLVAEQMRQLDTTSTAILLEPVGRNTAPAIAAAALSILQQGEDSLVLMLPADHHIADDESFCRTIEQARVLAEAGKLVTFGVVPTRAETGYGYIKTGEALGAGFVVERFVEKPDKVLAQTYIEQGEYLWNSGVFLFRASVYLEVLDRFRPEMLAACVQAVERAHHDRDFIRLDSGSFSKSAAESIDYAVMENTADAVVLPLNCGWNDVGSFAGLWQVREKDNCGNSLSANAFVANADNCLILAGDKPIMVAGVEALVIADTDVGILVANRDHGDDITSFIAEMDFRSK